MKILRGAELTTDRKDIFPTQWYVVEDDGTTSGPYATAEQAEEASKAPAMTLERLNEYLRGDTVENGIWTPTYIGSITLGEKQWQSEQEPLA